MNAGIQPLQPRIVGQLLKALEAEEKLLSLSRDSHDMKKLPTRVLSFFSKLSTLLAVMVDKGAKLEKLT